MRLRTLSLIALALLLVGGGIWAYGSNSGKTMAVGAGGLPLIKADVNPAKLPPEDSESEIIPNADSTVFAAMGTEDAKDPSMENVTPPVETDETKTSTEFAGFRTGFALPKEPVRKTESLFGDAKSEAPAEAGATENKYFSGIAPEAVSEKTEEPAIVIAAPEAKKEEPKPEPETKKEEPAEEPAAEEIAEEEPMPEPEIPAVIPVPRDNIAAQALEAEEKILVLPAAKPPVPKLEKEMPRVEKSAELKKQEDAPFNPVALVEKIKEEAPAPQKPAPLPTPPIDDVHPITPVGTYFIQLSSAPKGSDTSGTWRQLQAKYPQSLGGLTPSYQPATIPGKGEFVRIQAGPMSRDEANKRCALLKQANPNGGCLVLRR